MQASNRIIVNTLAQYIRTIINLVLSLYSSRLVLDILGVDNYGIYSLVAGVVGMLSFLTNSLVGSTQRFLSIYQGKGELKKLKEVFSNSLLLHIIFGLIICVILEVLTPFLFNGFLNIQTDRENAARIVYQLVVLMVYFSFIAAPYRALLVSRENIVYTSFIDVLNGVMKVVFVIILPHIPLDKLVSYGLVMLFISLFDLLSVSVYSQIKYEECIFPQIKSFSISYLKEISMFTGWVTYSTLCITARTQGLAIVLNKVMGTVANAAYGIGSQISGMVSFVSASLSNAIAPQLMTAEGGDNREHMWMLAKVMSKFSFLLLAMVGIPTMFEMQSLLELWLVEVPQDTMLFGCMFLSMNIIDMLTTGLGIANRAIGKIGLYTLVTYTPKLLILPFGWFILYQGLSVWYVFFAMIMIETICMLIRIALMKKVGGFYAKQYINDVIIKSIIPVLVSSGSCLLICYTIEGFMRFILTFLISIPLFAMASYKWALTIDEQKKILLIIKSVKQKIMSNN